MHYRQNFTRCISYSSVFGRHGDEHAEDNQKPHAAVSLRHRIGERMSLRLSKTSRTLPLRLSTLAAALALAGVAGAQVPADTRYPITQQQRSTADQVAQAGVPLSALAPTAPDVYTVKTGDTLWDISKIFLTSPWRWPELWGMNKQQVRNPHLIYPGQSLRLVRSGDRAMLVAGGDPGVDKLSPKVRDIGSSSRAIASIPYKAIEPFLSRPAVISPDELAKYPRIIATPEGRVWVGNGDIAYARGIGDSSVLKYNVFRPAMPLFDPDDTERRNPIAWEAEYLGIASLKQAGEVSTMAIEESKLEIGVGDRLIPVATQPIIAFVPRRPEKDLNGRVVSVYGGVNEAGTFNIITLNRGARDGVEIGNVFALLENGKTILDRTSDTREFVKLPDERIGEVFIFRTFEGISYGLVMRVQKPVAIGDRFSPPDTTR